MLVKEFSQSKYPQIAFPFLMALVLIAAIIRPPCAFGGEPSKNKSSSFFYEEDVQKTLKKYLGVPYQTGGYSRDGFDCSGFVRYTFKRIFGVDLPHNSREQSAFSRLKNVKSGELRTGDLLFFSSGIKSRNISHVGIYLSEGRFIHSQGKKGVIISDLNHTYWKPRLKHLKRLSGIDIRPHHRDSSFASVSWDFSLSERSDLSLGFSSIRDTRGRSSESSYGTDASWAKQISDTWHPTFQSLYMSYTTTVGKNGWDLGISAFRDEIPTNVPWHLHSLAPLPGLSYPEPYGQTFYRHGVRFGGNLVMDDGLAFRSSLGLLEYRNLPDHDDVIRRSFDVGVELASEETGWSILADFFYSDKKQLAEDLFEKSENSVYVDMSLTLRRQLTDQLGISITGQRSLNDLANLEDPAGFPGQVQKSLFFKLDFRY